jgi:hypothetical protein
VAVGGGLDCHPGAGAGDEAAMKWRQWRPPRTQKTVGAMLLVFKPCLVPVKAAWPCTQETVGTMLPPRLCSVVIVVI